jgi:hypothetical protein
MAQLQRLAMKLAMLDAGSFGYALGLNDSAAAGRYDFGEPPCRVDLRDHQTRKRMLEAVPALKPLPWLETLQRIAALPSLQPIDWAIWDIAKRAGEARRPAARFTRRSGEPSCSALRRVCRED